MRQYHTVLNDINYFTFCGIITYSGSNNIKFKIWMLVSFSCNFFSKIFANVLFFVGATYFAGKKSQISRFPFPATIALSLFLGAALQIYVSKQEISIGRCFLIA